MNIDAYDYLRISMLPGIGPARGRALLSRFGSFAALLRARRADVLQVDGFQYQLAESLLAALADERNSGAIERTTTRNTELCERYGYTFIGCNDPSFPALLKGIYDPPLYLFVRGTYTDSDSRAAAIVGTRQPSDYGKQVSEHFASSLARDGVTVVSGLALGIDTVAHRSALAAGGRSIAVMGSGLRRVYPTSNRDLAAGIAENGCVISELPLEAAPDATNFPRRNRIISGLSRCLLVMESAERGGAMISAQLALDQGREVFAVPGSIFNPKSAGPHMLLQKCMARPATKVEDVYGEVLALRNCGTPRHQAVSAQLSLIEQQIADQLSHEPLHIDEIAARTGLPLPALLVDLLQMEFKDAVRQLPGKHFIRGPALM
ncbi:MAG: DNA-processing protein DprA [Bacteroidia bacterium]|nr:DNA-processing protein DprA [Bacteroidia bacterium]